MRLLLVEDDDRIAGPLIEGLGRYGFTVELARTGAAALAAAAADLVLLDLGLPDMDGIDVCKALRSRSEVPIIMITARTDEADRVVGLELGADDYLSKPFGVRELVARIRAVTRRTRAVAAAGGGQGGAAFGAAAGPSAAPAPWSDRAHSAQRIGPMTIDRRTHRVELHGRPIALAPKEFGVLEYLAQDPGALCSRQQIMDAVWDPHYFGPTRTLDVHVAALRRKLGDPAWIETVRGVGFRLADPTGGPA
ncbi:response regulator transcription factor [Streptomyces sp. NPDC007264]|uniref:response regulator transcription factor n=1 Tax=Streptomyces sp. NPDC007264 TaxID=3364777 RepID=UPI0036DE9A22